MLGCRRLASGSRGCCPRDRAPASPGTARPPSRRGCPHPRRSPFCWQTQCPASPPPARPPPRPPWCSWQEERFGAPWRFPFLFDSISVFFWISTNTATAESLNTKMQSRAETTKQNWINAGDFLQQKTWWKLPPLRGPGNNHCQCCCFWHWQVVSNDIWHFLRSWLRLRRMTEGECSLARPLIMWLVVTSEKVGNNSRVHRKAGRCTGPTNFLSLM